MTDIVERLRATRRAEIPARASLWEEAADEIERLRLVIYNLLDDGDETDRAEARSALEGKQTDLVWPNPSPPTEGVSHYDHIRAHGFTIEWKSWKDYHGYCLMKDGTDEKFIGCFNSLEEAKEAARAALEGKE